MSVLDSFYLLFKGDASNVNKVLDDVRKEGKKTAKELEAVDNAAFKMGESIGNGLRQMAGAVAGFLAVQTLVHSFNEAVTAADKLDETAQRLGISVETLSVWGDAAKEAGGSTEGLIGSVEAFNNALAMMEVTGKSRAAPFLKELGIDLDAVENKGKSAFQLFPQIAAAMEGMDVQKSGAIGRKLGLDAGTIMLLQMGGKSVDELLAKMKGLGVITKEQGEIAAKFKDQLDDTKHAFRSLFLEVSTAVLPVLTWLGKKFEEVATFMRENSDFIVGLMIAIGAAIAYFAIPPLLSMAAAALVALAPFLLMAAAVAAVGVAFALIYDDIVNFMAGNDSLIGQFLAEYPQVAAILQNIGGLFQWLADTAVSIGQIIWAAFGLVFKALGTLVGTIFQFWIDKLAIVGEVFTAIGSLVAGIFNYWIEIIDRFISKFGGIVGIAKTVGAAISGVLGMAKSALGIETPAAPAAVGPTVPKRNAPLTLGETVKSLTTPDAERTSKPATPTPTAPANASPRDRAPPAAERAPAAPVSAPPVAERTPAAPVSVPPVAERAAPVSAREAFRSPAARAADAGVPITPGAAPIPGLPEGKAQLGAANKSPISSMTSNSISNAVSSTNKTTNVTVGKVDVNTQATDAQGISKSVGDTLGAQLRQAASNYDDGVAA